MSNPILVTGATGTVGSEVVRQLSARGVNVCACCHTLSKADMIRGPGVEIKETDYTRLDTVEAAFKGSEKLFLVTTPLIDNLMEITPQLVEEAKKAGIKHIVKLSNMDMFTEEEAKIPPIGWHRQEERIIEESGIPYTFLRPAGFMQNFFMHVDTIKAQNAIYTITGEGTEGFIDARDIAAVAVEALTGEGHEGKIYSITGPEAVSYDQAAEVLSDVLGRKITHVKMSEEDARKGFVEAGWPDWLLNAYLVGGRITREGRTSTVTSTVEEVTGKKPTTFEQFAREHAEIFK
ncbi:MAG: SDR family oxidoreductase [Methanobacteriota archaeon]|nr:MAG: SDR family oxidoreductase [Euryarchaeota archaeon]